MKHTIDATNQKLGRIASQAAALLMGKNLTSFVRHQAPVGVTVEIKNAKKIDISPKRSKDTHSIYSGYPGGLRYETWQETIDKKGIAELYTIAIRRMLPNNRLRKGMLKRLIISE